MQSVAFFKRLFLFPGFVACFILFAGSAFCQQLTINDSGYFEKRGVNVFVFSGQYNGMFFDEKTAGIELIHHGVRTATGGAVRLQNTPDNRADYILLANAAQNLAVGK